MPSFPTPTLIDAQPRHLVGIYLPMSHSEHRVQELWQGFMPRRGDIQGAISNDLFSVNVYPPDFFAAYSPAHTFTKWAAMEADPECEVPKDMERLTVPGGLYAVFHYQGPSTDPAIFGYIYGTWLPQNGYRPDARPHFEVLGDRYSNTSPMSEEDIWVPVVRMTQDAD
jgi:AraC family transcriptional regulator